MMSIRWWGGFVLVAIGGLVLVGPVAGQVPDVQDQGGFFSEAAVRKAREAVKEIKLLYRKDLRLETFLGVPADKAAQFKGLKEAADRRKFMTTWARARAQALHVDGIYILVCKNPATLEVIVDLKTTQKIFPAADRTQLRDVLVANFKAKKFDQGLADAIALVRQRFEERLSPAYPTAVANVVKDHARFFSPEAVARADKAMKEFQQRHKKDLAIETFPAPPPDKRKLLQGLEGEKKSKVFNAWLGERSRAAKVEGIHVLICREPAQIQVGVSNEVSKKAFPPADRERLVRLLVEGFKEKKYDQALSQAVDLVDKAFIAQAVQKSPKPSPKTAPVAKNGSTPSRIKDETPQAAKVLPAGSADKTTTKETASAAPVRKGFDPMWIVWGLLILLGLWILIGLLRALFGRGRPPVPREQPYIPTQPHQAQGQPQVYHQGQPQYGEGRAPMPAPGYGGRPPMAGQAPAYGQAPPPPASGGGEDS